MKKVYCKNCKWFKRTEYRVNNKYMEVDGIHLIEHISYFSPIPMCHHPNCFKTVNKHSPTKPVEQNTLRKKGQAQLNPNNHCPYYQHKWWKFWINEEREDD